MSPERWPETPGKLLVTSIGGKTSLLRELRNALLKGSPTGQIVGGDLDPDCLGRHFVDHFWQMPADSDLTVDDLIHYCHQQQITVIFPTRDGELPFFSNNRDRLAAEGIATMISAPSGLNSCRDKIAFAEQLTRQMPACSVPTTTDLQQLQGDSFVVKERYGSGSRNQLLDADRQQSEDWATRLNEPIFQPYLPGQEFSIDVYVAQNGIAKGAVVRSRDLVVSGEAKISTTVRNKQLEQTCCKLAEQLQLTGHVIFQGIQNAQGTCQLLECNCRFGGASTLSIAAGLDSFYWFLLEAAGKDLQQLPFIRAATELRQIRYTDDRIIPCS